MTALRQRGFGFTILASIAIASGAKAQHNVPANQQDGENDCGPAAAASCLKWFQQNGYANLKDSSGNSGVKDLEKEIEKIAKTGKDGTWTDDLKKAMNDLVDGTSHKGQLRAKFPPNKNAYSGFGFLDDEFSHNEDILLLLTWTDSDGNEISHYVTVKNITGSGANRTVEYMDPASGTFKTGNMNVQNNKLHLAHDGNDATVGGIMTMSPANTTTTTSAPNPGGGTDITYTSYFPSFRPTKDLHVWVSDCVKANYSVSGLPAGWSWDVRQVEVNGRMRCYLSFWKGAGAGDLANGGSITVTYTGPKAVKEGSKVITPTTEGTDSPTDAGQPPESGHTVAAAVPANPPDRLASCALAVLDASPLGITAFMQWSPSLDTSFSHYEVYKGSTGELAAETTQTELLLENLEPDVPHEFVVAARNMDVLLSEDSERVGVYLDVNGAPELSVDGPQIVDYVSPLFSGDAPKPLQLTIPNATGPGQLLITTVMGRPLIPLPEGSGSPHTHYYHVQATSALAPGLISLAVPYHSSEVKGNESEIRLFAFFGDHWLDITTNLDPDANIVFGASPMLTTFLVVNSPNPIPATSQWGLLTLALFCLIVGTVLVRRTQAHRVLV